MSNCMKDCEIKRKTCSNDCSKIDIKDIYSITIINNETILISKKLKKIMNITDKFINDNLVLREKINSLSERREEYIDIVDNNNNMFHLKVSDVICTMEQKQTTILLTNIGTEKSLIEYYKNVDTLNIENKYKLIKDLEYTSNEPHSITTLEIEKLDLISDFFGYKVKLEIVSKLRDITINSIGDKNYKLYCDGLNKLYIVNYQTTLPNKYSRFLQKIQNTFSKTEIHLNGSVINMRFRAGISFSGLKNKITTSHLSLVEAKDKNLYINFYDTKNDKTEEFRNSVKMVEKITNSLKNDNFIPFYQPIINNHTGEITKYEVLVRMIDEDRILSPYFFLELSKRTDQYHSITRKVIEKSFETFQSIYKDFSINISYLDIKTEGFIEYLTEMIKEYKVGNRLVLELLEDEPIEDISFLKDFIKKIKKYGVKISIDDFGSGYSNFGRLLELEVDYLKIDAELIKNIERENNFKIVSGIVSFAKSLNLRVVAEYVENENILNRVKDLNIDYSQGYYFYEPLKDIIELEEKLNIINLDDLAS